MAHPLIEKSQQYKKRKTIQPPVGFQYNQERGAWLSISDSTLLVQHRDFPAVGTKKEDVETGEDRKGE